ncbi:MAG: PhnD/SsuA/transferrin family substrate-binding protein [Bacillota bacterium]|nr:PhnD/SsuA/transferrin family substrate-binding protein [Bacillota bacterium]
MKKIISFLLAIGLTLALVACGEAPASSSKKPKLEKVKLAVTGIEGVEQLHTEFGAFKDELEKVIGLPIEFHALTDNASAVDALKAKDVDIVLAGGADYVLIKNSIDSVYPIAAITRPGYIPIILSHADSGISSLTDIKPEHIIGTRNVGSTSGHLMPLKALVDAGLELNKDVVVRVLGNANEEAFLDNEIDLLPTTLINYQQLRAKQLLRVNIIWQGNQLPNDLLVGGSHLDKAFVEGIRTAIVEKSDALMAAILVSKENEKYAESRFVEANDSEYAELREAYKALGLD